MIPIAPKAFRSGDFPGKHDGCFPLSCMEDQGELEISVGATLGGNWTLKTATTATFKITLHILWTEDVILPQPWKMESSTDVSSRYQFSGVRGKVDQLWVCDSSLAAFAQPTANWRLEVDGLPLFEKMTGAQQLWALAQYRVDSYNDIDDHGYLPVISPTLAASIKKFPAGTTWVVDEAGAAHVAAGATPRYTMRRFIPLSVAQTALYSSLLGVKNFNAVSQPERIKIAGKTAVSVDYDRTIGANMKLKR